MSGRIFINYRRSQSLAEARHLETILKQDFGGRRVFIDVSGIEGFEEWLKALKQELEDSAAMVSVIGKDWEGAADDEGNRRLDNPEDFVRFEIEEALRRGIPVLPVLLDGAAMPAKDRLPVAMHGMLRRQAMDFHVQHSPEDAAKICKQLRKILEETRNGWPRWAVAGISAASLVLGVAAGPYFLNKSGLPMPFVGPLTPNDNSARPNAMENGRNQAEESADRQAAAQKRLTDALTERDGLQARLEEQEVVARQAQDRAEELKKQLSMMERDKQNQAAKLAGYVSASRPAVKALEVPVSAVCPIEELKKTLGDEIYRGGNGFGFSFYKDDTLKARTKSADEGIELGRQPALLEQVRLFARNAERRTIFIGYSGKQAGGDHKFCGWVPWDALVNSKTRADGTGRSFIDIDFDETTTGIEGSIYGWSPRFLTLGDVAPTTSWSNALYAKSVIQSVNADMHTENFGVVAIYDKPNGKIVVALKMFNVFNIIDTYKDGNDEFFLISKSRTEASGWVHKKDQLIWGSGLSTGWLGSGKGIVYNKLTNLKRRVDPLAKEPENILPLIPQDQNIARFPILGQGGVFARKLPEYYEIAFIGRNEMNSLQDLNNMYVANRQLLGEWLPIFVKASRERLDTDQVTVEHIFSHPIVSTRGYAPTRVDGKDIFNLWIALDTESFAVLHSSLIRLCSEIAPDLNNKEAMQQAFVEALGAASGDRRRWTTETFQRIFQQKLSIPGAFLKSEFMKLTPQSLSVLLATGGSDVAEEMQNKVCRFSKQLEALERDKKIVEMRWDKDAHSFQTMKEFDYTWLVKSDHGIPLYYIPLDYFP